MERIKKFEKNRTPIIELVKQYLLDFRIRLVHKNILEALAKTEQKSNDPDWLNMLSFISNESSLSLQLQCFRGVLSEKDKVIHFEAHPMSWEKISACIANLAEKLNEKTVYSTRH